VLITTTTSDDMTSRQPPHKPLHRRAVGVATAGLIAIAASGLGAPAADARLVPLAGVWPTNVVGAANPLAGTPFVYNGAYASGTPSFRVWLASRGRHRKTASVAVGRRLLVRGRLRNPAAHRSIGSAIVTIVVQNVYSGTWYAGGSVVTNRKGRFHARIPVSTHTRLAAIYSPAVSWSTPVFSRRLLIRAKSRVYLAKPYRNRGGRRFRFDGKVSGSVIPAGGVLVALQVRNRHGRWLTPRLARTRPSGRFRIRYRFPRRARLAVRIRMPSQTAWPLFGSTSQQRRIRPR